MGNQSAKEILQLLVQARLLKNFFGSGCWTNALQPLWIAGKVMSHYSEHTAIVDTLIRIERETGWATAWRVEDLKDFWGDYDNDDECDVDMDGMT